MTSNQVWDALAREYAEKFKVGAMVTDWRLGHSIVEELLGDVQGKRILDYGCGSGKFSRRLRDRGAFVIGVDTSLTAIELARQAGEEGIVYHCIPPDDLSTVPMGAIDHAVATFVFCTIQEEYRLRAITRQIYERLPSRGTLTIGDPHPDSLGYNYVSTRREKPSTLTNGTPIRVHLAGMDSSFYDYWKPIAMYRTLLEEAGFRIETIREPILEGHPEETFWKDERVQAPNIIIQARK